MIVGLLQLIAFLGTAWLIGHAVDLCYGRSDRPRPPGGTPPAPPSPVPAPAPELAGHR